MTASRTDVTALFEHWALQLKIQPARLAMLVNDFDTMPLREWERVAEIDDVEKADIERLRALLFAHLAKARNH